MVVPCTHASGGTVSRTVSAPLKGYFEAIRQLLNEDTHAHVQDYFDQTIEVDPSLFFLSCPISDS